MKPCYSSYNCPHCVHQATCQTYQLLGKPQEGESGYEARIKEPEKF